MARMLAASNRDPSGGPDGAGDGVAAPAPRTMMGIAPPAGTSGAVTASALVAGRNLRKVARTPQLAVIGTIQGAVFLLILTHVFGGAINLGSTVASGRVHYVDFLVPGYLVTTALFAGTAAASGMAEDIEKGFSDRLRSLPVVRAALLTGRSVADTALLTWSMVVAIAVAFAAGFRLHGSAAAAVAAFGLCIVFGFAFTWLFIFIGSISRSAQAAQSISLLVFPLGAVSSAWVPVETMPGWLRPVAENQPVTAMTNAVRSLALGDPVATGLDRSTGYWVLLSLLWSVVLVAVFAPLAVARYARS